MRKKKLTQKQHKKRGGRAFISVEDVNKQPFVQEGNYFVVTKDHFAYPEIRDRRNLKK